MTIRNRLQTNLAALRSASPPLTAVGLIMLGALAASLLALLVDSRVITGAPAWLKPAKFAASLAIYSLTLAWILTHLPGWTRVRRVVGWTTAVVFLLEIAIIDVQAWRGTTSHFNVGTPLDRALFAIMGLAILVQTLASILVAVALWRHRSADRTLGWALRLGMTLTILGAATGGLMTRPTAAQLATAQATGRIVVAGAHTVGGPDGGPGLPGTGWSLQHGDLRIPHFVGLHAIQALPVFALLLTRRGYHERRRLRALLVTASSYAALFAILLWQALRGQPVLAPDLVTVAAFAAWAAATLVGLRIAIASRGSAARHRGDRRVMA